MKNTLDFNNALKKRKSGWRGDSESDNRQYTRTNYRNIRKKISDHFTSFKSGYTCTLICYFVLAVVLVGILMVVLRGNNGDIGKGRSAVYYDNDNITNAADQLIIQELEEGDFFLQIGRYKEAAEKFKEILRSHPSSPRALWGYAQATDVHELSGSGRSPISVMNSLVKNPDVPHGLLMKVIPKLIEKYVSEGSFMNLDKLWVFLSQHYSHDQQVRRLYALELDRYPKTKKRAEMIFKQLMETDPSDCVSMAMVGKAYNLRYHNHLTASQLLQKAVDMDCEGVRQTRIYYQLGDAYIRLGQIHKAHTVHNLGAERGLFLSRDQRSYHNADMPLTARPWWTHEQTTYQRHLKILEENWKRIRDEALNVLKHANGGFLPDAQGIVDEGIWKKLELYGNGERQHENCRRTPKTCQLIDRIPDCTTLTRGQVKFSMLQPGAHLYAHCGPTNCRIRAHLGLQIPEGPRIRVGNETRTWKEGKFIIFDDSFEHEVWHDGNVGIRLVLIVDFWHPDFSLEQRQRIRTINS